MNEYIVLGDETIIENAHILSPDGKTIFVYVNGGVGLEEMFAWFNDSEKTRKITAYRYGETTVLTGFTELFALRIENSDLTTACLRKVNA